MPIMSFRPCELVVESAPAPRTASRRSPHSPNLSPHVACTLARVGRKSRTERAPVVGKVDDRERGRAGSAGGSSAAFTCGRGSSSLISTLPPAHPHATYSAACVVPRCLEKDPAVRLASMDEVTCTVGQPRAVGLGLLCLGSRASRASCQGSNGRRGGYWQGRGGIRVRLRRSPGVPHDWRDGPCAGRSRTRRARIRAADLLGVAGNVPGTAV